MTELVLIIVAAALVNNFVLVQFLGLCPFLGASRRLEGAVGMGLATGLVLTLASALSYLVDRFILLPLELAHFQLVAFILVIGAAVQFTEITLRATAPMLHRMLGLYIPLIASNCAVLGVALINARQGNSLAEAILFAAGAALGFGLVLSLLGSLRERIDESDVPMPFRGVPITLLTAGLLSLAFYGFTGFARL